jgi:hypothetical protein
MTKLALPLSAAALAALAACSTTDPVAPAPAPVVVAPAPVVTAPPPGTVVVQPQAAAPVYVAPAAAIRSGTGRIESINPLPTSAATGSGSVRPMKRLGVKMDDGTVQYVDTAAENLSVGQRIELTHDGYIRH